VPRCPFCREKISELVCEAVARARVTLVDDSPIYVRYSDWQIFVRDEEVRYRCPKCDKDLGLRYRGQAAEFLKGEFEIIPVKSAKTTFWEDKCYILYNGEVYERTLPPLVTDDHDEVMMGKKIKDELKRDIIAASF